MPKPIRVWRLVMHTQEAQVTRVLGFKSKKKAIQHALLFACHVRKSGTRTYNAQELARPRTSPTIS